MKLSTATAVLAFSLANGAAFATAPSACDTAVSNVVQNCGFETGDLTNWIVGGSAAAIAQTNLYGVDAYNPYTGSYEAFLGTQGATLGTHLSTDSLTLSQALDLEVGRQYTVSFELAQDTPVSTGYTNFFSAVIGGTTLMSVTNTGVTGGYVQESFTYTATTSLLTTLTFLSQNDAGNWFLDDIEVTQVPEPASMAVFGAGLLALAGFARARRRA